MRGCVVSTDVDRIDFAVARDVLRRAYWSPGIPRDTADIYGG